MYSLYIKILILLLVSSCLKEQDLSESNQHYLRLFRSTESQLALISGVTVSIYRVRVFNAELDVLEATKHFKASGADKKIDIKLKSPGSKKIIIEALDDKSKIVFIKVLMVAQGSGFSYVAWPDNFEEYKEIKAKDYSIMFKLTDDSSASFQEVDNDYSTIRNIFDKYQCTTCHSAKHEINLRDFVVNDSKGFYRNVLRVLDSGQMPPKKLKRPSKEDLLRLRSWVENGDLDDINQKPKRALKKRSFEIEIVNRTDGSSSLRSLDSNDLNTSYVVDLKNLAYGSTYEFILREANLEDTMEVIRGELDTTSAGSGLIFKID